MIDNALSLILFFVSITPYIVFVYGVTYSVLRRNNSSSILSLTSGLCVGPILLSFTLELVLRFFPFYSSAFYVFFIVTVGVTLSIIGILLLLRKKSDQQLYSDINLRHFSKLDWFLLALLLMGLFSALVIAFFLPLKENDPLEYASTAKQIYLLKDVSAYPFIDTSISSGYYGPWTHGLGYINLWVWGFLLDSSGVIPVGPRVIAVYYVAVILVNLYSVLGDKSPTCRLVSMVALFGTPIIFVNAISSHIDTIRIASFFIALSVFFCYLKSREIWTLVLASFLCGFALYTHSLNLLLFPIIAVVWLLDRKKVSLEMVSHGVIFLVISLLPVAHRYYINTNLFGSPIADFGAVPVWHLPQLYFVEWFQLGRLLDTPLDRLVFGVGKGLSQVGRFGFAYVFLTVAFFVWIKRNMSEKLNKDWFMSKVSIDSWQAYWMFIVLVFMTMVVVSWMVGLDSFIKNERYTLTIQPMVVLISISYLFSLFGDKNGR